MDIYEYLGSPDIAEYCRKIKHNFNSLEMAVIVEHSNRPIQKKHEAWEQIIRDYPDMPIREVLGGHNFKAQESLYDYLRGFIEWEKGVIEGFNILNNKEVYSLTVGDDMVPDGYYSSVEKAFEAFNEYCDECPAESFKVSKCFVDSNYRTQEAYFNSSSELLSIVSTQNDSCFDRLDMIYIHLPLPFEKGDIVTNRSGGSQFGVFSGQCVLVDLPHWRKNYNEYLSGERGDGTDMVSYCYGIYDGKIFSDHGPVVWDLVYFDDELTGQNRFLKYLSEYIKSDDTDIPWLISVYEKFKKEADYEDANGLFGGWYKELNIGEENDL